jgi:hypothetical protein
MTVDDFELRKVNRRGKQVNRLGSLSSHIIASTKISDADEWSHCDSEST